MSPWLLLALFVASVGAALLAFGAGLRFGLWRSKQPDPEPGLPLRTLVASILALLAFVLGFTFDLAESHANSRMESVLQETISLARAYHLTELLQEPDRADLRRLIRGYVDARLEVNRERRADNATIERLRGLQEEMWLRACGAERSGAHASSLLQALGEAIDIHGERALAKSRSRISFRVWFALFASMVVAMGAAGYMAGLCGAKRSLAATSYALVFSIVIVLIAAGDVPGPAQFQQNREALTELRSRLTAP